jgi:methionine-S-sulfoxide reductase
MRDTGRALAILTRLIILTMDDVMKKETERATFAGGCFWCMEDAFSKLEGVIKVESGYTGGEKDNPTYEDVCSGETGHYEAIQITFDPSKVTYEKLLEIFWENIDPTDEGGQFADRGSQYRTAIFYHSEEQRKDAEKSKSNLEKTKGKIATSIIKATKFFRAEEYHQDYSKKNASEYNFYKAASGRADYIRSCKSTIPKSK